ncbi:MAG TPA: ATP synthase F1 subunit epsilon [Ruminococcaceae bacterium]|nr:ATP synthase F1 subunit epsilon [Oscillospiraceae bacterium]
MASTFHLQIVTPDGLKFDGQVENIVVRTTEGDVGILKNRSDYMAAISVGPLKVKQDGQYRLAAVSGGFLSVTKDITRIVATTFEWADEIDKERALNAKAKAQERLNSKKSDFDIQMAELKLKRALNRINIADKL